MSKIVLSGDINFNDFDVSVSYKQSEPVASTGTFILDTCVELKLKKDKVAQYETKNSRKIKWLLRDIEDLKERNANLTRNNEQLKKDNKIFNLEKELKELKNQNSNI